MAFTKISRDVVDFVSRPLNAGVFQGITIDSSPIGANAPSTGVFTNATANNVVVNTSISIPGGSINGTPIGSIAPSTGRFTNLNGSDFVVTHTANFTGATVTGLNLGNTFVGVTSGNGYVTFPGGLIMQWGEATLVDGDSNNRTNQTRVTFPTPFINAVFSVVATLHDPGSPSTPGTTGGGGGNGGGGADHPGTAASFNTIGINSTNAFRNPTTVSSFWASSIGGGGETFWWIALGK